MATRFKPSVHFVVGSKLLAVIAGTELMIMLIAGWLNVERWFTPMKFDFVDTSILSITASFVIFYWVIKPLEAASKTIGEYKSLEKILLASEHQYRSLFENNPQPMFIYDRDTLSIFAVNDAAVDHYGYSREEFLAMTIKDFHSPEEHTAVIATVTQLKGKIRRPGVWRHKKKDGTLIDVDIVTYDMVFNGRAARHVLINDVTEQQKSQKDLRIALHKVADEKARSEAIIAAIGDGITIQDRDFRIIYQNDIAMNIMGNHVGGYCYSAYEGMEHTCEGCPVALSFEDDKIHTSVRSVHTDKGIMYFENTASALKDSDGKIIAGIEVVRDITERKIAEQGIVRLNRLYSVLSSINEAIIRIRKTDDLCKEICRIAVEQGMFRMAWIGFIDPETLLVKPAAIYGHEEGYLNIKKISVDENIPEGRGPTGTAIISGGYFICNDIEHEAVMAPWRDEALMRGYRSCAAFALKRGEHVVGSINVYSGEAFYFQKEGGEIIRLLTRVADNISFAIETIDNNAFRMKAEEDLQKSEAFVNSILESIGEGIVVIDPEYRIISANRAYCELHKVKLEDIAGKHCYEISHHVTKPCFTMGDVCAPMHTFKTGAPDLSVHTHYGADNNPVYIEAKSFPMKDASGKITAVIQILNSLTEQKKLEDQLRQSQKMEAIGMLAGGVAHDFNNILSAIIGYGHLSLMKMKPDDPVRQYIDQILSSSQRAAQLTQSLLSFSRKRVINPVLLDLNELVQRFEKFILRLIREDIKFTCRRSDGALPVMADSGQIEQAIMNIVTNARDAIPDGGRLLIETDQVRLDKDFIDAHGYCVPGEFALISITDTGIGMNETTKTHIFEPFFTTKEVGKGTGLGLSMVYGIIKKHDGFITVDSEPGKGTTFKIYLPVSKVQLAPEEARTEAPVPSLEGTETILIVEDDEPVRRLTTTFFQNFGYTVIEAVDGEDAVQKFIANKDRVQLAILDVIMPKKNGGEVFREITAMKPGFPVLFVSGYSAEIVGEQGILEPGTKFVPKPVSPLDLLKKVREALDNK